MKNWMATWTKAEIDKDSFERSDHQSHIPRYYQHIERELNKLRVPLPNPYPSQPYMNEPELTLFYYECFNERMIDGEFDER